MSRNSCVRQGMKKEPKVCLTETSQEVIRRIAQQLYEKRGKTPGHELDDWLEAEKVARKTCVNPADRNEE